MKTAVIYWNGTSNTEASANTVTEGDGEWMRNCQERVTAAGAELALIASGCI